MAKSKVEKWLEPEGLILLEGWKRSGLTDEQIANNMGIHVSTIYEYMKKYSEINDALKRGKEVVDFEVENALYKNAVNGNVVAQIFWLKNRNANKWKDKVEHSADKEELTKVEMLLNKLNEEANK